jgi:DNA polymerase-1
MGFNPASPKEVGYILAERGNFLPFTKSRRQLSTNELNLRLLDDPVARLVLLFRHAAKVLNTYLIPLRGKDRAYTTFHTDAFTGRISSTSAGKGNPDRNLMNIPKKTESGEVPVIRSAFLPDDDEWLLADFSQIELRVLAHLSRDQNMLSVFQDPKGNFHAKTAEAMRIPYDFAKIFNYALIYGGNEYVVAANAVIRDVSLAKKYMKIWMATYPQAAQWMVVQKIEGIRNGSVESLLGRRMPIPIEQGQAHAEHCCVNFPIQCTAGEIFKLAILECLHLKDAFRLIVHDELDLSGHHTLPSGLENVSEVYAPLAVDYRARWG